MEIDHRKTVNNLIGSIKIRSLRLEDAKLIFEWRNDPFIVARSTSQRNVTWDEHLNWIRNSIENQNSHVYLVINQKNVAIGQVRFNHLSDSNWVISVYLLKEYTGRGIGVESIKLGCATLCQTLGNVNIYAFVRNDNVIGVKAFKKAEFYESSNINCPENHISLMKLSEE